MRQTLSIIATCALLLTTAVSLAQEKKPPSTPAAKDKRVEKLMREMERIRQELAKEGVNVPATGAPDSAFPIPPDVDPAMFGEFGPKIKAQHEKLQKLTEKHGPDSPEVRKAVAEIQHLMARATAKLQGVPAPGGTAPGLIPAEQLRSAIEAAALGNFEAIGGVEHPAEMGQKMVSAGFEVQLKSLADAIRNSEDEEIRAAMTEELKELVGLVVDVREKYCAKQIERLEKRLSELRDQAEHAESADAILDRLLAPPEEAAAEAEQPDDGAQAQQE